MQVCKICNRQAKSSSRSFGTHLVSAHNMTMLEYAILHEGFVVPKCPCGKDRKLRKGLVFNVTCGSKACRRELPRNVSETTKLLLSAARLKWLKDNPDKTAWRLGKQPSWPEKYFMMLCKDVGLVDRFQMVRELSVFPYFVDFAFTQIKVAVEVDGSQHLKLSNQDRDKMKDGLLQSLGWRIFRIPAKLLYDKSDREAVGKMLIEFIGSNEKYENVGFHTSSDLKRYEKDKQKENKIVRLNEIHKFLNTLDLDNRSWTVQASEVIGVKPASVRKWIRKNLPGFKKIENAKGTHKTVGE